MLKRKLGRGLAMAGLALTSAVAMAAGCSNTAGDCEKTNSCGGGGDGGGGGSPPLSECIPQFAEGPVSAACGVSAQIAYSGPIEPDTESGTFGTAGEAGLGGNSNQLGNAGEPGTAVNILKIPAM